MAHPAALPDKKPDTLPRVIFYRLSSGVILTALPHRDVESISSSGATNAAVVRPRLPPAPFEWSDDVQGPWKPHTAIPAEWMRFVNRPTESL
jgi:hypothetical protein